LAARRFDCADGPVAHIGAGLVHYHNWRQFKFVYVTRSFHHSLKVTNKSCKRDKPIKMPPKKGGGAAGSSKDADGGGKKEAKGGTAIKVS
jgi:hypothetical protein